ncbi:polysaccharide biosynthesis tyrosine autokinase [Pedobacter frigidisoli]|uniref:non-specific protein-tyrosine kinase n=1 Tax=Pedobacter frigidisoli TaxID=2530455 RepID=A0A4R0NRJ3_9SPHI|nr:tyrosine-protein kinase family protein [Pedobacter frigidisoli]TCD01975.1 polysaccharide biosynthesis tyrosine autokinase [Pedobacter frigidisoli]
MIAQSIHYKESRPRAKVLEFVNLKDLFSKYLFHWPLFFIVLSMALLAAIFYTKVSKPTYEIKATLLIKDQKKAPDQQSALHEIDMYNSSKIVENEIEILSSKKLSQEVVNDLRLWIGYEKVNGFMSSTDLYKASPVNFNLLGASGNYAPEGLDIVIKNDKTFLLKMPSGELKEMGFSKNYTTELGEWRLDATNNLNQYINSTIKIKVMDPDQVAIQYQKGINVILPNKLAAAIDLSLNDTNAERGKDVLNRLIYHYNLAEAVEKNRETKSTLDFLDRRLASLTGDLTNAEKGIEDFKSTRGLTDLSSDSKISLENMQANDLKLMEVNIQLNVIEGVERYVNSPQNQGKAPATSGITDAALSSSIEKLSVLQLQREKLLATTPETNPDFEAINRQISSTKMAIKEIVENIKSALLITRSKLQTFNSRFESSIKNVPVDERQFISIKRQQAIKESSYNYLLQKKEEVSLKYAATLTDDRIVDQAYANQAKFPQKPIAFALALFIGLALPTGLIYGRDVLKNKITTIKQIKDEVNVPVIGEIPYYRSKNAIAINDFDINSTTEQFRALRTKLHYLFAEQKKGRVTMVTSSIGGEGKSFISANLALSLAHIGKKTVVLELDLRKPKIADIFSIDKQSIGITDFLTGNVPLKNIIKTSGTNTNLDVITCGTEVKSPAEMLEKEELKDLIDQLKLMYDDIIIDTAPAHLVPDAMILGRVTDITLYVIRQGFTGKSELSFISTLAEEKQLPELHILFNGINKAKYGYGYDYSNNYYNTEKGAGVLSIFQDFKSRF